MNIELKTGDLIYEIHSLHNILYINRSLIKYITPKNRIICDFNVFNGLNIDALNNFNQSYRCWYKRGNHLNMFTTYSTDENLKENISKFMNKYKKITGSELLNVKNNY